MLMIHILKGSNQGYGIGGKMSDSDLSKISDSHSDSFTNR